MRLPISKRRILLALFALVVVCASWPTLQWYWRATYNRGALHGGFLLPGKFITGVNYPWLNYGGDFGTNSWGHRGISDPQSRAQLETDFADLQKNNIRLVRWFVFCDFRAGFITNPDGSIKSLDPYVFQDMDAAVEVAREHNMMIMFVLFDFSMFNQPTQIGEVKMGGRRSLVTDPVLRRSLLDNAVQPLLQRYGNNGAIVAWEVINEPEWVMSATILHKGKHLPLAIDTKQLLDAPASELVPAVGKNFKNTVTIPVMQEFVTQVATLVHQNTAQIVSVGSAKRDWVYVWNHAGLDFYQFHHYAYMEKPLPYDYPAAKLQLDKPIGVGEFPSNPKSTPRSLDSYLNLALKDGYAGALPWSYRATDPYSSFLDEHSGHTAVYEDFVQWRKAHASVVGR
jgi:hypothetical protein